MLEITSEIYKKSENFIIDISKKQISFLSLFNEIIEFHNSIYPSLSRIYLKKLKSVMRLNKLKIGYLKFSRIMNLYHISHIGLVFQTLSW